MRYRWPNGAQCAVVLSFDVDAESGYVYRFPKEAATELDQMEERRFGVRTGVCRILRLLEKYELAGHVLRAGLHHRAPHQGRRVDPRGRLRDGLPRQRPRDAEHAGRGGRAADHERAACHLPEAPGDQADRLPLAVLEPEHAHAGAPEGARLLVRQQPDGRRHPVLRGDAARRAGRGPDPVAAGRCAVLPPRLRRHQRHRRAGPGDPTSGPRSSRGCTRRTARSC